MKKSKKIKCSVQSCDFQNCNECTLDEIQVDCSCGCNEATKEKETLCKSFRCCNKEKAENSNE